MDRPPLTPPWLSRVLAVRNRLTSFAILSDGVSPSFPLPFRLVLSTPLGPHSFIVGAGTSEFLFLLLAVLCPLLSNPLPLFSVPSNVCATSCMADQLPPNPKPPSQRPLPKLPFPLLLPAGLGLRPPLALAEPFCCRGTPRRWFGWLGCAFGIGLFPLICVPLSVSSSPKPDNNRRFLGLEAEGEVFSALLPSAEFSSSLQSCAVNDVWFEDILVL